MRTYKQAKAIKPGEDGKVCRGREPDLDVQHTAADF